MRVACVLKTLICRNNTILVDYNSQICFLDEGDFDVLEDLVWRKRRKERKPELETRG